MMVREGVVQQLREVLDRVTDGRIDSVAIQEDAHITDDLGLTSLELLELRFELESVWNVSVDNDQALTLRTVSDVVSLIVQQAA